MENPRPCRRGLIGYLGSTKRDPGWHHGDLEPLLEPRIVVVYIRCDICIDPFKMATLEEYFEQATAPGPNRQIPGCVMIAANKDGKCGVVSESEES